MLSTSASSSVIPTGIGDTEGYKSYAFDKKISHYMFICALLTSLLSILICSFNFPSRFSICTCCCLTCRSFSESLSLAQEVGECCDILSHVPLSVSCSHPQSLPDSLFLQLFYGCIVKSCLSCQHTVVICFIFSSNPMYCIIELHLKALP